MWDGEEEDDYYYYFYDTMMADFDLMELAPEQVRVCVCLSVLAYSSPGLVQVFWRGIGWFFSCVQLIFVELL